MSARLAVLLALGAVLSACSNIPIPQLGFPTTSGAFLESAKGDVFRPQATLDPRNAMVYIYRPVNQWGYEELQAPVFFIDGYQLFGLKSGAYEWLEVHGGNYDFYARRPFSVLYLKTVFSLPLVVEGGKNYYFRYSEDAPLNLEELVENPQDFFQEGPLQQVPEALALRELKNLRLDEPGVYYGGDAYEEPRWAPFYTYPDS